MNVVVRSATRSRRAWRRRSPADSRARSRSADLQDADDGGAGGGVAGGAAFFDAAADALRRARARPGGDRHLRRDGVSGERRGRASSGFAWRLGRRRATSWCSSSRQGMSVALTGVVLGLLGAFVLTRFMRACSSASHASDPRDVRRHRRGTDRRGIRRRATCRRAARRGSIRWCRCGRNRDSRQSAVGSR